MRYPCPSWNFRQEIFKVKTLDGQETGQAVGPDLHPDDQIPVVEREGHLCFRIVNEIKRTVLFKQAALFVVIDPFMEPLDIGQQGDQF